jgi:hypothetical protein
MLVSIVREILLAGIKLAKRALVRKPNVVVARKDGCRSVVFEEGN